MSSPLATPGAVFLSYAREDAEAARQITAAFGKAVFLSYASQEAETASRICEVLRCAGIDVWFDHSELVGGVGWNANVPVRSVAVWTAGFTAGGADGADKTNRMIDLPVRRAHGLIREIRGRPARSNTALRSRNDAKGRKSSLRSFACIRASGGRNLKRKRMSNPGKAVFRLYPPSPRLRRGKR